MSQLGASLCCLDSFYTVNASDVQFSDKKLEEPHGRDAQYSKQKSEVLSTVHIEVENVPHRNLKNLFIFTLSQRNKHSYAVDG